MRQFKKDVQVWQNRPLDPLNMIVWMMGLFSRLLGKNEWFVSECQLGPKADTWTTINFPPENLVRSAAEYLEKYPSEYW